MLRILKNKSCKSNTLSPKYFYCVLATILCISLSVFSFGQTKNQFLKAANQSYSEQHYYEAILYFEDVLKYDKNHTESHYKIGLCYYELKDYKEAISALEKITNSKEYLLAYYYLGEAQKSIGEYKAAINNFQKFIVEYREKDYFFEKANQEIASCFWAIDNNEIDATKIEHLNKTVNSRFSDFGATLFIDSTLQVSTFQSKSGNDKQEYKAWIGTFEKDGDDWEKNKAIAPDFFQQEEKDVANGYYLAENDEFYFTICETKHTAYYEKRCDIYVSQLQNNEWTEPTALNINIAENTQTQPMAFVDEKGNTQLFFSSDKAGGQGRLDIWQAEKIAYAEFTTPQNLGANINTQGDETTPFFHKSNHTLYFSSNWHYGYGGFDIFQAEKTTTDYRSPLNSGQPLNTSANDQYFYFYNESKGFLSSNREDSYQLKGAYCCFDIYNFNLPLLKQDTSLLSETILPTNTDSIDQSYRHTLVEMLPVTVYFHNDEPNPKTTSKYTTLPYSQCYDDYLKVKPEYFISYSNSIELAGFFKEKVDKGWADLDIYAQAILDALQSKKIKLTIEGYCSPLALNEYNINLAHRRIVSLENYLLQWNDGILKPYYNSGKLQFENAPFGEETAPEHISDDYYNTTESIFNPNAASERRVAIIAVEIE